MSYRSKIIAVHDLDIIISVKVSHYVIWANRTEDLLVARNDVVSSS